MRLWGDPFAATPEALALRAVLAAAQRDGVRCGLALTAVALRARRGQGAREVTLDDGAGGALRVATDISDADLGRVLAAAGNAVVATAPCLVFGDGDDVVQAGFEFPDACVVVRAQGDDAATILRTVMDRARAHGIDATRRELEANALDDASGEPVGVPRALVLAHNTDEHGLEPVLLALVSLQREQTLPVIVAGAAEELARVRETVRRARLTAEVVADGASVADGARLREATVVVVPWQANPDRALLARALAAGRVVVAPRCQHNADLLVDGGCLPVGGFWQGDVFVPQARHLLTQLRAALADPARSGQLAQRGRAHVLTCARGPRPVPAPATPTSCTAPRRPRIVLEAPLFELSSSSVLTLATARALMRRDQADVFLVARGAHQLAWSDVKRTAPDLVPHYVRQPPATTDLWLATGWPPRAARPQGVGTFAVRIDWEYGALPVALSPLAVQEADAVVVHSRAVEATLVAAGRARDTLALVPHGVDGEVFQPYATPLPEVLAWKRDRAAILFAGGLIWRKGIDLLLQALLQLPAPLRAQVALVVKPMGSRTSYRGFAVDELLHKFRAAGAVDTLVLERDLSLHEMAGLYTACDVYAQPYRGEGFCLPVLEALACGLPAVVTAGGATDDFAWGGGCLRVAATRRDIDLPEPCLSQPWVLEPDPASLGAALARAVRERRELRRAAVAAAPSIAVRSSWDQAAATLETMARRAASTRGQGALVAV